MGTYKIRKYRDIVYAIYTHKKQVFKVSTGIKISNEYWKNNKLSSKTPNYEELNNLIDLKLQELIHCVIELRSKRIEATVSAVRKEYFKSKQNLNTVEDHKPFQGLNTHKQGIPLFELNQEVGNRSGFCTWLH